MMDRLDVSGRTVDSACRFCRDFLMMVFFRMAEKAWRGKSGSARAQVRRSGRKCRRGSRRDFDQVWVVA